MVEKLTLRDVISKYKDGRSDASLADDINRYLPQQEQVTRQAIWQWQKKETGSSVTFYALAYHAPAGSPEAQLARAALVALGRLELEEDAVHS